jgi:hypothetical protein
VDVGVSKEPIAIASQSRASGSQNNADPHRQQKPRRTFAEDWNQVTFCAPVMVRAALGTFAEAKK